MASHILVIQTRESKKEGISKTLEASGEKYKFIFTYELPDRIDFREDYSARIIAAPGLSIPCLVYAGFAGNSFVNGAAKPLLGIKSSASLSISNVWIPLAHRFVPATGIITLERCDGEAFSIPKGGLNVTLIIELRPSRCRINATD